MLASFAHAVPQGATPPEPPHPAPVASSSGPERTKKSARAGRRYDPVRTAEKVAARKAGWDQTLPRFRARLHDSLQSARSGQPSGGFVPAMALANIDKLVKEDLEQSVSGFFYCVLVHRFTNLSTWQQPLRTTASAKGDRSRHMEDYLKGLLGAIHRARSTPKPDAGDSNEEDTSGAALSRRKRSSLRFDLTRRADLDRVP